MDPFILLVCVAGLQEFDIPDVCMAYTLQPQYEMTVAEISSATIFICEQARVVSIGHGGNVTKCEIVDEIPEGMHQIDPVVEPL
jgi:hypothetical protein